VIPSQKVKQMQTRRDMLKLMGLTTAAVVIGGCVPTTRLGRETSDSPSTTSTTKPTINDEPPTAIATVRSTETSMPTARPTETATITPTETVAPYEYSRYYEPEFSLDLEGEVDGINIPYTVGLHESIVNREDEPVKSVTENREDTADVYAKFWLTMCWKKFMMQNADAKGISFEDYTKLVKEGGGQIQIAAVDERTEDQNNKLLTFDPRNGFVYVVVDKGVSLPEEINTLSSIYFGMNEEGQLVIVRNNLQSEQFSLDRNRGIDMGYEANFVAGYLFSLRFAEDMQWMLTLDNDGLLSSSAYWKESGQGILTDYNKYVVDLDKAMLDDESAFFSIGQ
jgi:hypothetical protein